MNKKLVISLCIIVLAIATTNAQVNHYRHESVSYQSINNTGNLGIGLGIPYGIIGFGGEIYLSRNVSVCAGIGTALIDTAYNFGFRYYFRSVQDNAWRLGSQQYMELMEA